MEKDRGTKVLAVLAIVIAVIGTTIGFASFSTVLNINGTGQVKGSNWEIIFANLQDAETTGTAREVTAPIIKRDATLIETYDVELMTPGDEISYTFDILNNGTYNAKITGLSIAGLGDKELIVTGGADADDRDNVKEYLSYTLTYVGGDKDGDAVAVNDALPKMVDETPGKVTVKLTLKYNEVPNESYLPKQTVTIGGLDVAITYGQTA